jgi:hypothetical protein
MSSFIKPILKIIVLSSSLTLTACSFLLSSISEDFSQNLNKVILNHNDPQTVLSAIPAYLLMQEALIKQQPNNQKLLLSTSTLYRSYAALIDKNTPRLKALTDKAFHFGLRAACLQKDDFCHLDQHIFADFDVIIKQSTQDDLKVIYTLGTAWAAWIQAHKSDMNAIAQLAQVKTIMNKLVQLDEGYQQGAGYLYLAVLESLLPAALGGNPDLAKQYFEQAIKLSKNKNLMVKVLYAKHYARLLFDRKLHDDLLNQVVTADEEQSNLTLINIAAKQQAKQLLKSANDYF